MRGDECISKACAERSDGKHEPSCVLGEGLSLKRSVTEMHGGVSGRTTNDWKKWCDEREFKK